MKVIILSCQRGKFIVHPQNAALHIKEGIREYEFLKQLILDLSVLRRQANESRRASCLFTVVEEGA